MEKETEAQTITLCWGTYKEWTEEMALEWKPGGWSPWLFQLHHWSHSHRWYWRAQLQVQSLVLKTSQKMLLNWTGVQMARLTELRPFFSVLEALQWTKQEQSNKTHKCTLWNPQFLTFTFSMAQVLWPQQLAAFPVIEQRARDNATGYLFPLSVLHRDLCAREVTPEKLVKTKIFSALKLVFGE